MSYDEEKEEDDDNSSDEDLPVGLTPIKIGQSLFNPYLPCWGKSNLTLPSL